MAEITCMRCQKKSAPLEAAPLPGELGAKIAAQTCGECWAAWQKFSVMVINDFRLRPFLPQDRAVLERHLKQFLNIDGAGAAQPTTLPMQDAGNAAATAQQFGAAPKPPPK